MSASYHIYCIGLNHRSARVELRESLYVHSDIIEKNLISLKSHLNLNEVFVISTCNRFEIYYAIEETYLMGKDPRAFARTVIESFQKLVQHDVNWRIVQDTFYIHKNMEAFHHFFRVVSSLDSLIIGETQITGQIKEAIEIAAKTHAIGKILYRMMQEALETAKKIRTQTDISKGVVSVGHAALDMSKQIFSDLSNHCVAILGAGDMAKLTARHLQKFTPRKLIVANRTLERAQRFVQDVGYGEAQELSQLEKILIEADLVIASTGAQNFIVDQALVENVQKMRKSRPLCFIDISIPRNVDPQCGNITDVFVFDLDDLNQVAEENSKLRQESASKGEVLALEGAQRFALWIEKLPLQDMIKNYQFYMREQFIQILEKDLSFAESIQLSPEVKNFLEAFRERFVQKCSGDLSRAMKDFHDELSLTQFHIIFEKLMNHEPSKE